LATIGIWWIMCEKLFHVNFLMYWLGFADFLQS
jgi:hypothetical protein